MLKFSPLAVLLVLGLAPLARGDEPTAPAVARLIEQLGDKDFRKRDDAARALEARGAEALPELREALRHADAEVRRRAAELVPALEAASVVAPKRVRLNVSNKPLREVFAEITKQTGHKITYGGAEEQQPFSFDLDNLTFWQAMDRVCQAAGLVVQQSYGDDTVRLAKQNGHPPYVHHDGGFRFVANSFQHYRSVDFSLLPKDAAPVRRSDLLTFNFMVYSEPRMPVLGVGEVKLTAAFDSDKNSMILDGPAAQEEIDPWGNRRVVARHHYHGNRSFTVPVSVGLGRPSEKANTLKEIRGTVPLTLLVEQKPEVVTDKVLEAKGTKITVGTTRFAIEDVKETAAKQYELKMSITEESKPANPNDYTWMNSLYSRIHLEDEKGNKFQIYGSSWTSSSPTHAQVTFTYGRAGAAQAARPTKLVYVVWTTLQHQVNFEFKDLPLP